MIVNRGKQYNRYFQAYFDVHDIKSGGEVMFHEYSSWITDKHIIFRKMKGCPYCNGYPPDVQAEFYKFIREGVK